MDEEEKDLVRALSSHDKREHKRKEREDAEMHKESEIVSKEKKSQYFWIGVVVVILIAAAVGLGYLINNKPQTYTDREVHWHALLDISICGKHRDLPLAESGDLVHGKTFKGIHLLHTHDDNLIHIEGLIQKKEDIALGKFFDGIDVPFDKDKLMDVKNGDFCDGKPSVLKMFVNDQPRTDFRDYIPSSTQDARQQVIKLVFSAE